MEKSKEFLHQGDGMNPSAPMQSPIQIDQQYVVNESSYPPFPPANQHQIGSNASPMNTTTNTTPVQFHVYQEQERYYSKLHKHRRQTGSISGALFLMLVSGIHIGWGIWRVGTWPPPPNTSMLIFSIMAWPLGAIFGGFIGSALTMVLRKNIIYFITATVMIIGNVLHIIWDREYGAIITGRILISLAHGTVFVALITQAGENASRNMRGMILSTINCAMYIAIFITAQVTTNVDWNADFSSERILAIIALIFAAASIICTLTLTVETVPFLLMKKQPGMASETLKHLRDAATETPHIKHEMDELTLMMTEDKQDDRNPFSNGNAKPLILMLVLRLMAALTNNLLLNFILIRFCELLLNNPRYAPLLLVGPRLGMSVLQVLYADILGRKLQIFIASSLAGLTLIGLGIVLNVLTITFFYNYFIPSLFCIHFQVFCSMGLQQMSDVYLSEAFSTAKKPWSLSFVLGLENTFQIFMTGMAFTTITDAGLYALLFITGILLLGVGLFLLYVLPETKGKTLKQARDLFRSGKIFHFANITAPFA